MSSDNYPFPVAVSQLTHEDSQERQIERALRWLAGQPKAPVVVVTPQRQFSGTSLTRLVKQPGVTHLTWRGFSSWSLNGKRVVYAWPDRQHLNELWGVRATALVVLEWNASDTEDWIADALPDILLPSGASTPVVPEPTTLPPLLKDVAAILESTARWAAGYDSGLKWDEEDKLKSDMMLRPQRWTSVTVEQVRAKCRELGMRPNDVDTIASFLQRRKEGRRFNVRSSYRNFHFGD